MIANPNAPAPVAADIPAGKLGAAKTAIQALIAGWEATAADGTPILAIAVHDVVVKLRASPPAGVTREQVTGERVRQLLRELGYEPD